MSRWFNVALKLTKHSGHKKHKMAAVLVRGGSVMSKNVNLGLEGQHAETRALKHPCLAGTTLYIARAGGKMSRPCKKCWTALRASGVTKVVYADWNGKLCVESV